MKINTLTYGGFTQYIVEWRGQAGIGLSLESAIERCVQNVHNTERHSK